MIAFGPVPSRRLGRSLGINHIPPKHCTYACVYCQLGRTLTMQVEPAAFYPPEAILRTVRDKVRQARERGAAIDYLTFVADGEPTLDVHLGREIELLRPLGLRIAVITNGSLLWRAEVRAALAQADWVSLKVDAATEELWRRVDRPHGTLRLADIQAGMLAFAADYTGELVTETMLVGGLNDGARDLHAVADFLARLQPRCAYLAIPTRPPAEPWAGPPDERALNRGYQILSAAVARVEYLIGYEGDAFASTGNAEDDLLSITAVHPMREDAVAAFLARAGADGTVVRRLVADDRLVETTHGGHRFYVRRLARTPRDGCPSGPVPAVGEAGRP